MALLSELVGIAIGGSHASVGGFKERKPAQSKSLVIALYTHDTHRQFSRTAMI